jgi:hypothetical protein
MDGGKLKITIKKILRFFQQLSSITLFQEKYGCVSGGRAGSAVTGAYGG